MVTKSRNMIYKNWFKVSIFIFAVIIIFVLAWVSGQFVINRGNIFVDSYYESSEFMSDYRELAHTTIRLNSYYVSEEAILNSDLDDREKRIKIGQMRDNMTDVNNSSSFIYLFKNKTTGEVFGNYNVENAFEKIKKFKTSVYWDYAGVFFTENSEMDNYNFVGRIDTIYHDLRLREMLDQNNLILYTAINEDIELIEDDFFKENFNNYNKFKIIENKLFAILVISLVLLIIIMIYFTISAGKKDKDSNCEIIWIDRIPFLIQFSIFVFLFCIPFMVGEEILCGFGLRNNIKAEYYCYIVACIYCIIIVFLFYHSCIRKLKAKVFIKNTLIYIILNRIYKYFCKKKDNRRELSEKMGDKKIKIKLFLAMIIIVLFNIIAMGISAELFWLVMIIDGFVIYKSIKKIEGLLIIIKTVNERANGNISYPLNINKMPKELRNFAKDINSIQDGMKLALKEAVKNEKMKTELITNVTHDLKNPLTSIINYVDLLKKENINSVNANKYLDVLEEKSDKLKLLIEHLVEAARVSSGNILVNFEKIDLGQMMSQIYGEFQEELAEKNLELIVNKNDDIYFINADPKHLYRLIENLMNNISKYALENTRVYVDLIRSKEKIIMELKNVSKAPLNIEVSELTERFKRGDDSRNTEGNGLGLSIALNLATAMDAELNFKIDGDYFKAILEFKISNF